MPVPNCNAAFCTVLFANGVQPMICQEKGKRDGRDYRENKKRLVELAALYGKTLVLTAPAGELVLDEKDEE